MKFKILLSLLMLISFGISTAQKVKLKKDKVIIDGVETFKYEKRNWNTELLIYPLDSDEEIIFIVYNNNETREYRDDDFIKVHFIEQDLKLESNSNRGTWKFIIKWMAQNKLFKDKMLNNDKVIKFVDRYDENITDRTIRN